MSAKDRVTRFRKVLRAAQQNDDYRQCLAAAGLQTTAAIARVREVEATLAKIPISPGGRSVPRLAASSQTVRFRNPLPLQSRIAVAGINHFEKTPGMRYFAPGSAAVLEAYAPDTLAAPVRLLRELAWNIQDGVTPALSLRHTLVVFSSFDDLLTASDRDLFWHVFRVPLFEQLLGADGAAIAHECPVHAGLHVVEENAILECVNNEFVFTSMTDTLQPSLRVQTGVCGAIDASPCECEGPGFRLLHLSRTPARATAAA